MIISHEFKFIFIKTRKTAGTSIEVDLSKRISSDDIVTPITPTVIGHVPRNFKYRGSFFLTKKLYNHMPALLVKEYLGEKLFKQYFKFCVEREPVDKCISHYSFLRKSPTHNKRNRNKSLSFDDYVSMRKFPIDTEKYTDDNGQLVVDRILRYENLADELSSVCEELGFRCNLETKAKSGLREQFEVSTKQRRAIYRAFAECNKFTGYSL